MIFMSVGHSFSFSSLRRITNPGPNKSFENWIYLKVPGNCSNHLFNDDFDVSGLNPVTHKSNYVTNESLQISSCQ